jgi:Collagen triple helix repeat (20 copies)
VAGALVAAALSIAATPGDSVLRACVGKNGAVRLLPSGGCRAGESGVSWNERGPAGARGPGGLTGDSGADGPAGADGAPGSPGAAGQTGAKGARGSFSFDSFEGMPCVRGALSGHLHVSYGVSGQVGFTCS